MKLIHPMVKFNSADVAALQGFEDFINRFDDDYCIQIRCIDCPHLKNCRSTFGEGAHNRPYETIKEFLEFFKDIPVEEG